MIFVSTSCINKRNLIEVIKLLAENNILNIELSGGCTYIEDIFNTLIELKREYNLNYLVHNYFPPPKEDFILNLASTDSNIWQKSLEHYKKSIELAIDCQCEKYGLHAGFFIDPDTSEIGKNFSAQKIFDKNASIKKFIEGFKILQKLFADKINLYIENNVISYKNYQTFKTNPFMLTCWEDYFEFKKLLNFNFLFDVAHLQVSTKSLNLNFEDEFFKFIEISDYIHISDNDEWSDSNLIINKNSKVYKLLKGSNLCDKIITLESKASIEEIKKIINEINEWD